MTHYSPNAPVDWTPLSKRIKYSSPMTPSVIIAFSLCSHESRAQHLCEYLVHSSRNLSESLLRRYYVLLVLSCTCIEGSTLVWISCRWLWEVTVRVKLMCLFKAHNTWMRIFSDETVVLTTATLVTYCPVFSVTVPFSFFFLSGTYAIAPCPGPWCSRAIPAGTYAIAPCPGPLCSR